MHKSGCKLQSAYILTIWFIFKSSQKHWISTYINDLTITEEFNLQLMNYPGANSKAQYKAHET